MTTTKLTTAQALVRVDPVLQQQEHPTDHDASVNDAFRPLSRFFARITRPERLRYVVEALLRAERPVTVQGGGVKYAEAEAALAALADAMGIPVVGALAGKGALEAARAATGVRVFVVEVDPKARLGTHEHAGWWDVPVAEVSEQADVQRARSRYERNLETRKRSP